MGKGEIVRYEQFLLFPLCFQKARFPGASKGVIVWEWVTLQEFALVTVYLLCSFNPLSNGKLFRLFYIENVFMNQIMKITYERGYAQLDWSNSKDINIFYQNGLKS